MNPDRRDFLALGVGALAVATLPELLRRGPSLVRRQIPVMGTIAEIAVLHLDEVWAQRGIDAAFAELRRVESAMTRFRPDSDIGRINGARGSSVPVGTDTAHVVRAALDWSVASEGRFDPCLGGAVALWDVGRRTAPPSLGDVQRYADRALWKSVDVRGGDSPRIRLHDPDGRLDLGGIAKGFGVDRAADRLRDHGIFSALVNVGGDLVALGTGPDGESWRVGVRSPEDSDRVVGVLRVHDAAIATSGDYLQYFERGGRRYHHLLDPRTGEPRRTAMRSLTVESGRCMHADAAATALFGADQAMIDHLSQARGDRFRIVHRI